MDKQVITTINGIEISAVRDENNNFFVPVKPICDAIGVNYESQYAKLKDHEILASTIVLSTMVASDGKQREMVACHSNLFTDGFSPSIQKMFLRQHAAQSYATSWNATTPSIGTLPAHSGVGSKKTKPKLPPSKLSTRP